MSCGPLRERLDEYLDGELPPPEAAELESHLRECTECSRARAELERLDRLLQNCFPAEPDDPRCLERPIERARERLRTGSRPWRWLAAAAALVGIGLGALHLLRPAVREESTEEKVERLIRTYLARRDEALAGEISSYGTKAIPVVLEMLNRLPPQDQVRLSRVIASFRGEQEVNLILEYSRNHDPAGDLPETVIGSIGLDEEDRELLPPMIEILADPKRGNDPKMRRLAQGVIESLTKAGLDREADAAVRRKMLEWLKSSDPELARRALELSESAKLRFEGGEIIELLTATDPAVRTAALEYLRKISGENFGSDPEAWRRWLNSRR